MRRSRTIVPTGSLLVRNEHSSTKLNTEKRRKRLPHSSLEKRNEVAHPPLKPIKQPKTRHGAPGSAVFGEAPQSQIHSRKINNKSLTKKKPWKSQNSTDP